MNKIIKFLDENKYDFEISLCISYVAENIHWKENMFLLNVSKYGRLDLVKYIVSRDNFINPYTILDALLCASLNNHLDIVKFLIKKGDVATLVNEQHFILVISLGYLNVLKYLIRKCNVSIDKLFLYGNNPNWKKFLQPTSGYNIIQCFKYLSNRNGTRCNIIYTGNNSNVFKHLNSSIRYGKYPNKQYKNRCYVATNKKIRKNIRAKLS